MADRTLTAHTVRKGFAVDPGGGGGRGSVLLKNRRIATAAELGLAEHLAVLDEATELPPFGFNIAGLEQRLERRLGLEITPVRCLLMLCFFHRSCRSGYSLGIWHAANPLGLYLKMLCVHEHLRIRAQRTALLIPAAAAGLLYVDGT